MCYDRGQDVLWELFDGVLILYFCWLLTGARDSLSAETHDREQQIHRTISMRSLYTHM